MNYTEFPPALPLSGTESDQTTFKVILLLFSTPLIILTILGNSLIISTWIFQKSVRTPSNLYFISLAVADLITGLFAFPPTVHYSYTKRWAFGLSACRLWLVMCFSMYSVTAFHLVAIAVDRHRTITQGVAYLQRRSMKYVCENLAMIWCLSVWVTLPVYLDWEHISKDPTGQKHCVSKKIPYWVAHYCCASFWFPAFFLVRIYLDVYRKIKSRLRARLPANKQNNKDKSSSGDNNSSGSTKYSEDEVLPQPKQHEILASEAQMKSVLVRERRSAITLVIISGAFLICWLPWNVLSFYDVVAPTNAKPPPYMFMFSAIFGLANSFINPIVYAARVPEFRKALTRIYNCRKK